MILRLFTKIAELDSKIEITRQVLLDQEEFQPKSCFYRIDRARKNTISAEDILNFLQDNADEDNPHLELQVGEVSRQECELAVQQFDHDGKGYLYYEEFLDMILPLA